MIGRSKTAVGHVAPSWHIFLIQSQPFPLLHKCSVPSGKHKLYCLYMVRSEWGSNPRSTALNERTLTITPIDVRRRPFFPYHQSFLMMYYLEIWNVSFRLGIKFKLIENGTIFFSPVVNSGVGLRQAHKCGGVKPVNRTQPYVFHFQLYSRHSYQIIFILILSFELEYNLSKSSWNLELLNDTQCNSSKQIHVI